MKRIAISVAAVLLVALIAVATSGAGTNTGQQLAHYKRLYAHDHQALATDTKQIATLKTQLAAAKTAATTAQTSATAATTNASALQTQVTQLQNDLGLARAQLASGLPTQVAAVAQGGDPNAIMTYVLNPLRAAWKCGGSSYQGTTIISYDFDLPGYCF